MTIRLTRGLNPFAKKHNLVIISNLDIQQEAGLRDTVIHYYHLIGITSPQIIKSANNLIIECLDPKALLYLVNKILAKEPIDLSYFNSLMNKDYLDSTGWTTRLILHELEKKDIPWCILGSPHEQIYLQDEEGFKFYYFVLGFGNKQRRLQQSILDNTSDHSVQIATSKQACKRLMRSLGIPTPPGEIISSEQFLIDYIHNNNFNSYVIKPNASGGGLHCYIDLKTKYEVLRYYKRSQKYQRDILVEEYIEGEDARICVINYQFICALKRTPPTLTGNGKSTIKDLIEQYEFNQKGNASCRDKVLVDEQTMKLLDDYGFTLDSILAKSEKFPLQLKANIASGARVTDITNSINTSAIKHAETICRYLQLNIASVDFVITPEGRPYIIEVNACPGLDNHMLPNKGKSHNFAKIIADTLYSHPADFRVPLIYVNDKDYLFGEFQASSYESTQIKLQDSGASYLVFHCPEYWDKGLPVSVLDVIVYFNENNYKMLNYIPDTTLVIINSKALYTKLLNNTESLQKFKKRYYLEKDVLYNDQHQKFLELNTLTDILTLTKTLNMNRYTHNPSILIPKEFYDE